MVNPTIIAINSDVKIKISVKSGMCSHSPVFPETLWSGKVNVHLIEEFYYIHVLGNVNLIR